MPSTGAILLGLTTSFLLVTGCCSLECFACNETSDVGCSSLSTISCNEGDNACAAVSFYAKLGNLTENLIVRGCDRGFPMTSVIMANPLGVQILASRILCDSSICNQEILDLSDKFPDVEGNDTSDLQCYSCLSTNKSKCSTESAEKVNCSSDLNACYEAEGNITIRGISFPFFVKKCSEPTNDTAINIDIDVYSLSLNSAFCSENLCNENLLVEKPVTVPPNVTSTETETPPTTKAKPVTSTPIKTTSGIGRTCPCYLMMIILVIMKLIF
ncbi:ly6/PLAUR domain-containing protein 5 [Anomaloglossus baeobatrachus]|uniref:ly6/PLAUR domain-containing protein 5-like n=1 Tax=Anomaloglossus baeobatrachus TaxID=238106 RepID=UPI003F508EB3